MAELPDAIAGLTGKARRLLAKNGQVGEENTKAVLVEPMLQALGWDTHDLDEVQREFRYKSQDNPVDYALFVSARPRLFVEAKGLGRDLGNHKWKSQAVNYANTAGVEWCVLTDGNFWQVYKSNAPGDLEQKLFLETWLHSAEGRTPPYEPHYVLSLLAKEKLTENAIQTLWQVLNVDRRGRKALLAMVEAKDPSLVRLLRSRAQLTKKEVEAFLSRAEVTLDSPTIAVLPPKLKRHRRQFRGLPTPGIALAALRIRGKGVSAAGRATAEGFIVYSGSQAVPEEAPHLKGLPVQLRAQLLAQGTLIREGDHLQFAQDHVFSSPSLAAQVVLGHSAAGSIEWRDEEGRSLKELQGAEPEASSSHHARHPLTTGGEAPRKKRQRRGVPSQRTLEVPLLRAIVARGGEIVVKEQGGELDTALAREFGVTTEQEWAILSDGKTTAWSNRIRWTRLRLVKSGDLDGSKRGVWRVTEQGRRRAGRG